MSLEATRRRRRILRAGFFPMQKRIQNILVFYVFFLYNYNMFEKGWSRFAAEQFVDIKLKVLYSEEYCNV